MWNKSTYKKYIFVNVFSINYLVIHFLNKYFEKILCVFINNRKKISFLNKKNNYY